ncbi:MAG: ABC transporter ATP-binding protein [Oscillospiraceae bacterium]|nr:ABC transporter ATP-binding protein [Oscillospiraceae bacterium]
MVRTLLKSLREYKTITLISPFLMLLEIVFEIAIPYVMSKLVNEGVEAGSMSAMVRYAVILVVLAVVSLAIGITSARLAAAASAGFAKNLRHDMFYKVQEYSFANIDKFSTASIVTRLTTDVSSIQQAFMMSIRIAVRAPLMLIFSFIMVLIINGKLSLIFLCAIPVLGTVLFFIHSHVHPIFKRIFKRYDKLNSVVQENLRGVRVVKSFVRQDYEIKKFKTVSGDIYNDFTRAEKIMSFNMPAMQSAVHICILLLAWLGARIIVSSNATELNTGELMSLITYAMQILMSLQMLSMVFVMMSMSRAAMERAAEILTEESDIRDPEDPVYNVADGSITFENVSFSYAGDPDKLCLTGVDLEIRSGETVGILGGTGSSKSTLVQLIPRLYDATSGVVKVGGVDVREYDLTALRDAVSMVLQKNVLFSGTIKDNLRWGDENATDEDIVRVCRLACADEFINEMPDGYDTYIEQGGTNVSGGQKQRLCIARALLKHPAILILDDSTSAVDTATDAKIREAFRSEIPNTTKLIIAQRVSSVQDADKIIVLDNGRINGVGTHEELLATNEIYREVYESQTKGGNLSGASE